jgi:hypothetical protein
MKIEELESRLQQVDRAIEEMKANYNVLIGNRNEIMFWIQQEKDRIKAEQQEVTISAD